MKMYRFRGLKVHHLMYFEPQKFKSGPGVVSCGQILSSQAPSVSYQVTWLCAGTMGFTLTVAGSSECVHS